MKIEPFRRMGKFLIEAWIYNAELYMQLNNIPEQFWVKTVVGMIHQMHFDEIRPLRHLPYWDFKRKVITLFKRPDLTQSKLNEFLQSAQERDESVETYMERLKTLGQLPFRKMGDAEPSHVSLSFLQRPVRS